MNVTMLRPTCWGGTRLKAGDTPEVPDGDAERWIKTGIAAQTTLPADPDRFKDWDVDALKAYAAENGVDIGSATSANGIIKKITEAGK
ncbi:MAG: hypothetical protein LBR72_02845 [Oscillospiraceae bacterium]|jgi:hypothetical protein|nr:hypothetical protein [Oscillospiraceae bacterium]